MKRLKSKIFKIYSLSDLLGYEVKGVDGSYLTTLCRSKFEQVTDLKIRGSRAKRVRLVEVRRKSATSFRIGKRIQWNYEVGMNDALFNKRDGFTPGEGYLRGLDEERFEKITGIKLKDGEVKIFKVVRVRWL